MKTISDRLIEARKACKLEAREAAEALGVPYPTYSGHERGADGFKAESAIKYARKYKVSLDWLLTGKGRGPGGVEPPISGDEEIRQTLSRIEGLNTRGVEIAFEVIKNHIAASQGSRPSPSAADDPQSASKSRHES